MRTSALGVAQDDLETAFLMTPARERSGFALTIAGHGAGFSFAHSPGGKVKTHLTMFEKEAIGVTCTKCGHEGQESVAGLKADGYTCPKCGATFDPTKLARALKQIEGSFATFSDS
jgi:predicted nucleic-acid-binding Zn-ribbon protein